MEERKQRIVQEIIKLKTTKEITQESKSKIQKLQQELDEIEYEETNKEIH